jgi:hypothetical protein
MCVMTLVMMVMVMMTVMVMVMMMGAAVVMISETAVPRKIVTIEADMCC